MVHQWASQEIASRRLATAWCRRGCIASLGAKWSPTRASPRGHPGEIVKCGTNGHGPGESRASQHASGLLNGGETADRGGCEENGAERQCVLFSTRGIRNGNSNWQDSWRQQPTTDGRHAVVTRGSGRGERPRMFDLKLLRLPVAGVWRTKGQLQ